MGSSNLHVPASDYFSRPAGHFTNNPPTPTPSAFQLRLPTNVKRTPIQAVSTSTSFLKPAAGAPPKQASMLALSIVLSNGQTALQASCYQQKYPVKDVYLWIPPRSDGKVRQTLAKFRKTQPDRRFLLYLETRTLSEHPEVSEAYFIGHLGWSATAQSWTVRVLNTTDRNAKPKQVMASPAPDSITWPAVLSNDDSLRRGDLSGKHLKKCLFVEYPPHSQQAYVYQLVA